MHNMNNVLTLCYRWNWRQTGSELIITDYQQYDNNITLRFTRRVAELGSTPLQQFSSNSRTTLQALQACTRSSSLCQLCFCHSFVTLLSVLSKLCWVSLGLCESRSPIRPVVDVNMERDDTYVAQLYQVFKSCDIYGTGLLGEDELFNLCMRLQLDDRQTNYIITNLIGDDIIAKVSDTRKYSPAKSLTSWLINYLVGFFITSLSFR